MKATALAESSILYFIFSSGSLCYSDVYRREAGRCHTLRFFLTFFCDDTVQVSNFLWSSTQKMLHDAKIHQLTWSLTLHGMQNKKEYAYNQSYARTSAVLPDRGQMEKERSITWVSPNVYAACINFLPNYIQWHLSLFKSIYFVSIDIHF